MDVTVKWAEIKEQKAATSVAADAHTPDIKAEAERLAFQLAAAHGARVVAGTLTWSAEDGRFGGNLT